MADQESMLASLLRSKRFSPFFFTQFFGAFNDNLFKQSVVLLVSFGSLSLVQSNWTPNDLNNLGAAVFILPFFIFSAFAGQLADLSEKSRLIRHLKTLEIVLMILAAIAFYFDSLVGLFTMLFFMGMQSSFFGPVKYSIIPQHLEDRELTAGNALVEAGTFLAIILGYLAAATVMKADVEWLIGACVILFAIIGRISSQYVPSAPSEISGQSLNWNIFSQTWATIQIARRDKRVWLSVLGISWFWFMGATYMTQLPEMVRSVLYGSENVYIFLLSLFSLGVAIGSVLCEKLSGHRVEIGLVPFGAMGLTIFGFDLYWSLQGLVGNAENIVGLEGFFDKEGSIRLVMDFVAIGVFGGFYIVPLYAFVQQITHAADRARVIAANNILNAFYMVFAAALAIVYVGVLGFGIDDLLVLIAILNVVAVLVIFRKIPEFSVRFFVWALGHTIYRVDHKGLENIPEEGPCLLVCNHVSFVDAMLLMGAIRRNMRFVMFKPIYHWPILGFIFRAANAIPIHSKQADPDTYEEAFDSISEALKNGEAVCIFPEGRVTTDGEVGEFKGGVAKILGDDPVPVIPLALKGLWGSFFSHKEGRAFQKWPKRFWSRVEVVAGEPLLSDATQDQMREAVLRLRGDAR